MFSMKEVAEIKPVLADEGVVDLHSFELALKLGWSGVAIKACKWHSSSLIYIARFKVKDGMVETDSLSPVGLGFSVQGVKL